MTCSPVYIWGIKLKFRIKVMSRVYDCTPVHTVIKCIPHKNVVKDNLLKCAVWTEWYCVNCTSLEQLKKKIIHLVSQL